MSTAPITLDLDLDEDHAWALAQFVKRCSWSELRALAVDDAEARQMGRAVDGLQRALARAGYAPR